MTDVILFLLGLMKKHYNVHFPSLTRPSNMMSQTSYYCKAGSEVSGIVID